MKHVLMLVFLFLFICLYHQQDATAKILDIMEDKPDLIIGNYTDGNLVASLMASKLGVTQVHSFSYSFCTIFSYHHLELKLISITNEGNHCSCFGDDQI